MRCLGWDNSLSDFRCLHLELINNLLRVRLGLSINKFSSPSHEDSAQFALSCTNVGCVCACQPECRRSRLVAFFNFSSINSCRARGTCCDAMSRKKKLDLLSQFFALFKLEMGKFILAWAGKGRVWDDGKYRGWIKTNVDKFPAAEGGKEEDIKLLRDKMFTINSQATFFSFLLRTHSRSLDLARRHSRQQQSHRRRWQMARSTRHRHLHQRQPDALQDAQHDDNRESGGKCRDVAVSCAPNRRWDGTVTLNCLPKFQLTSNCNLYLLPLALHGQMTMALNIHQKKRSPGYGELITICSLLASRHTAATSDSAWFTRMRPR